MKPASSIPWSGFAIMIAMINPPMRPPPAEFFRRAVRSSLPEAILARIRAEGALKSSDFETKEKRTGGWWGWKDEKRWLEALFAHGDLMIARRENFQRVYDLSERVLAKMKIAKTALPPLDAMR